MTTESSKVETNEVKSDVVTGYYEQDGYKIHYEKVGHGDCAVFIFPGACGESFNYNYNSYLHVKINQ